MPPKPPSKNTADREYFDGSDQTDTPHDDVISVPSPPSSLSSTSKNHPKSKSKTKSQSKYQTSTSANDTTHLSTKDTDDFVEITKSSPEPPSPTPSDLILQAEPEYVRRLTALNELWKGRGVSAEKRKRKILEKQDEFERESAEVSNVSKGGQESVEDIGDDDNDDFYDADDGIVGKKGE